MKLIKLPGQLSVQELPERFKPSGFLFSGGIAGIVGVAAFQGPWYAYIAVIALTAFFQWFSVK